MATFNKFNAFVADLANGVHNLGSNQLVVALTNTAPSASNATLSAITEISYTGLSTRNITTTSSTQTSGTYSLVLVDLTLTASGASSYVWNTTATTAVIAVSPTTTTSYTVTGTNAAGCSAVAVISQSVSTCTDIKNSSFNSSNLSFLVYPNPSNGLFNVQLESASTIEVTDVLGRVILTDNVNAGTYQLNLGTNVNGVYFVKSIVNGKTKTVKIIKE